MRQKYFCLAMVLLSGFILSGCLKTRSDLSGSGKADLREQLANMQSAQAQQVAQFQEYDRQIRELRGRIEVLENQLAQEQTPEQKEQEMQQIRQMLDERLQAYEEALAKLDQQVQALSSGAKSGGAKSRSRSKVADSYAAAEKAFAQQNWKAAIVQYQKYRDSHPKGKKYADATYKIGVCFQELGMKDEAKAFYQEVLDKFPKSREAKKADYRLGKMS